MNTCENCKWWKSVEDFGAGFGACRRFPPRTYPDSNNINGQTYWPVVRKHDFCGEHTPKDNARPRHLRPDEKHDTVLLKRCLIHPGKSKEIPDE